ncbi:MAG: GNAT family N-acetyltransferase [Flavobacteriales bacterium]|nr:GNAT family N-acetyltransferase [Flavobacteriales bacterium]
MEFTIRRAEPEDVPAMLELVRELAVFEKEPEAVTVTEAEMLDAGFGEKPVWWGWVAEGLEESEVGSRKSEVGHRSIVGIAVCYERYSTWRGRVGYLEDIVVTDRVRGQGVGEKLFKACVAECARRGYHHLTWQVLDWNEGAIRFYKRLGAELDGEWVNGRLHFEQLQQLT